MEVLFLSQPEVSDADIREIFNGDAEGAREASPRSLSNTEQFIR